MVVRKVRANQCPFSRALNKYLESWGPHRIGTKPGAGGTLSRVLDEAKEHGVPFNGVGAQAIYRFPNGRRVSVVCTPFDAFNLGLWELAELGDLDLNPIAGLTVDQVNRELATIILKHPRN